MNYQEIFQSRTDLNIYQSNALLLFALEIFFQIEDIHSVATEALTDGSDDKKCDLIYISPETGNAVIAQGYFAASADSSRTAPSNKASDLNTAAGWIFTRNIEEIPEKIKYAVIQLRNKINDGTIRSIEFWYVHNLKESQNVQDELKTVERTAFSCLQEYSRLNSLSVDPPNVSSQEIGVDALNKFCHNAIVPILVSDEFQININKGFEIQTTNWSSFSTSIALFDLYQIFSKHGEDLFSANIRGYLGSRKADSNINNGIKNTAQNDAENFWVYNNGITALVNNFSYEQTTETLTIQGLSIVNGAQTTGAIGNLSTSPDTASQVPIRFVKCTNSKIIQNIIKYNNNQNKIEAPDFRSNDKIQTRLRREFESIIDVTYLGGRRGGSEDQIRRPRNLLPSETAGQALVAFHGDPVTAYNEKSNIWISDSLYSRHFSEKTTAKHIVFVYSLQRAIENKVQHLKSKSSSDALTEEDQEQLSFFRKRGALFLFLSTVRTCLETIVGEAITDYFKLSFKDEASSDTCSERWMPIVDVLIPFAGHLSESVESGLNNNEQTKQAIKTFSSLVSSTKRSNQVIYTEFKRILSL